MDDRYKGLEKGAAQHGQSFTGSNPAAELQAAAQASAAISFKRLVDLLEPVLKAAAAEAQKG